MNWRNWKNFLFKKKDKILVRYQGKRFSRCRNNWKWAGVAILCICLLAAGAVYWLGGVSNPTPAPEEESSGEKSSAVLTANIPSSSEEEAPIVALDAGHGGVQPGCVAGEILEKDITLSVTIRLKEKLEEKGLEVFLTRDSDEDVELSDRANMANQSGASCFVSLHCNWYEEDPSVSGLDCYYYQDEAGMLLAQSILDHIANVGVHTRELKEENFEVLWETTMPATLIELGFMTNPEELESLQSQEYQDKLASAIAEGIQKMLEETGVGSGL